MKGEGKVPISMTAIINVQRQRKTEVSVGCVDILNANEGKKKRWCEWRNELIWRSVGRLIAPLSCSLPCALLYSGKQVIKEFEAISVLCEG